MEEASEFRRDLITRRWVVIAVARSKRPNELARKIERVKKTAPGLCVFCPGNEDKTPPEIQAYRDPHGVWKVRVVANKFRILSIEGELKRQKIGILRKMTGLGAHEVIITTPDHAKTIYDLTVDEMNDVLWMGKERIVDLRKSVDGSGEPKIQYINIFANDGEESGASQEHSHFQLTGLPFIPEDVFSELLSCKQHWEDEDECIFCAFTEQEQKAKERIVCSSENYFSIAHYSARFPFETWVLPTYHRPLFEDGGSRIMRSLADTLVETLRRLGKVLNYPDVNIFLHNAPLHHRDYDRFYHHHIEIKPALNKPAGFEWGTGVFVNPVIPEEAADALRSI